MLLNDFMMRGPACYYERKLRAHKMSRFYHRAEWMEPCQGEQGQPAPLFLCMKIFNA
jgi:hypothetical protein